MIGEAFHAPTYAIEIKIAAMKRDFISIKPSGALWRLVLLHGWGADADDLLPLGKELVKGLGDDLFEIVALRAPEEHPDGLGRQWYRLFPPDWDSVPVAIANLRSRIEVFKQSSISLEKTILLGFSQGAAMALATGLDLPLGGIIGCSGYPHLGSSYSFKGPPVLLIHGTKDEIVPLLASKELFDSLKRNYEDRYLELVLFEGGHEIPQDMILRIRDAIKEWII